MPVSRKRKKKEKPPARNGLDQARARLVKLAAALSSQGQPEECRVQQGWERDKMAHVAVLRRSRGGWLVGGFLVDLLGLGLKDGYLHLLEDLSWWEERSSVLDWEPCSLATAQEIVYGGLLWSRRHGFHVPRDALDALAVLPRPETEPDLGRFGDEQGRPVVILRNPEEMEFFLGDTDAP
jgi:hypothetical protein